MSKNRWGTSWRLYGWAGSVGLLTLFALFFSMPVIAGEPSPAAPAKALVKPQVQQPNAAVNPDTMLWLKIEDITVVDHGSSMSWYAKTVTLANRIAMDQLEIRGYQLFGNRVLGEAGETMTSGKVMSKGDRRTFARQNWQRVKEARKLKVEIVDKRNNRRIFKVVDLPAAANRPAAHGGSAAAAQVGSMDPDQFTDPQQVIRIEEATYLGRGAYRLRLKNEGNRGIMANQLVIRPAYHVLERPVVLGETTTNRGPIPANGVSPVSGPQGGIYIGNVSECAGLKEVVVEIKNPQTGQELERSIPVSWPKGEIVDADMYLSQLSYTVKNTGDYTTRFKLRMLSMEVTRGKYDHLATVHDIFHTTVTLKPGETKIVSIPQNQVNAELKAQVPSLKSGFYGADNYMVELYTDDESDYCFGRYVEQASLRRHGGIAAGEEILFP